ncbi:MAG TPA: hypothetical protein VIV60_15295 [Polyangiaceae bacterium]
MDIQIINHGSIVQLLPLTDAGQAFLRDDLESESWQWMGNTLCVEPRQIAGICNWAREWAGIDIQ